jgi:Xaa-Pro aminopeptidase
MAPIQKKLINVSLLSASQLNWLNDYHQECLQKLSPILSEMDPEALRWLQEACSPIVC